jgi:hypothetical protein
MSSRSLPHGVTDSTGMRNRVGHGYQEDSQDAEASTIHKCPRPGQYPHGWHALRELWVLRAWISSSYGFTSRVLALRRLMIRIAPRGLADAALSQE